MAKERIILGIDPGTNIMGYGVIKVTGNNPNMLCLDVVHLNKLGDHYLKLKTIFEKTLMIIDEFNPDEVALEAPFFGKNVQSMLKLGRAQGVAMAAALSRSIPVFEYLPKKVKMSVTGNGNASKEQLSGMLQSMYNFKNPPKYLDATDGLAVATCHFLQSKNGQLISNSKSGWKSFLKENPDRIG
ncbi:MAG: crossover junction endodeoxyribonuclease RuvC [Schleiferiaceae bacterium]|jgi:crossover junction endodeoxyribonuclease RuvC|nr:crossover junction endodeoxyribonuclease RuvC [Schleiferiaceae bacterium]